MPRYLGQHFLKNKKKIKKIVDALELKAGDVVVEIGPGHGELTKEIIARLQDCKIAKLIAIEKDKRLAFSVKRLAFNVERLRDSKNLEVIQGDALKILPEISKRYTLNAIRYKIVGNIPYYITGHLLRILGELKHKPSLIVLTIQKEVAERVCALKSPHSHGRACPPKFFFGKFRRVNMSRASRTRINSVRDKLRASERYSHAMNLLAASVQFWAEPEIIGYIPKKDFSPAPKVDSAIITLSPRTNADWTRTNADNYYRLIHILFKQPRKTILNNLASGIKYQASREETTQKLLKIGINPQGRPQDLSIKQLINLTRIFNSQQ